MRPSNGSWPGTTRWKQFSSSNPPLEQQLTRLGEHTMSDVRLHEAARAIAGAEALVLAAAAGMGVDSGMPDFRGDQGFWNAYPAYAKLGLRFVELANPRWFRTDPALAWGFYGHRLNLYRANSPHEGFAILLRWAGRLPHGGFVYTSNVDGHFRKAGFDPQRVVEIHGTVHWMQCLNECGAGLFESSRVVPGVIDINPDTFRAREPLPTCPACGQLARPNILMFSDGGWDLGMAHEQELRLREWVRSLRGARV